MVDISYGIIRIEKYHREDILGIESHDKRKSEKGNSNKDIDWSLSPTNYDLHFSDSNITFTKKINERIAELKLSKAPRKDAVVMAQVLITSDYKFFENISQDEQKKFFRDSYDFICKQYGKENIISAIVHLDEMTPHMHINFVPVTSDGRLSAKDLFDRRTKSLNRLQDNFFEDVAKGYGLERGEEGSNKKHLTVAELKLKTAKENAAKINERNKKINQEINSKISKANEQLKNTRTEINSEKEKWEKEKSKQKEKHTAELNRYAEKLKAEKRGLAEAKEKTKALLAENKKVGADIDKVRCIQPTKNLMGFIQNITLEQIQWLKDVAESHYYSQITYDKQASRIYSLKDERDEALSECDNLKLKLREYSDENSRLRTIEKAFLRLPQEERQILLNPPISQQRTVQQTVSKRKGYDR